MADLNVKFLKGTSTGITNFTGNSIQGAFYLAEDICKLYYGTGTGAPVPLNEQITIVDKVSSLPNPARAENLLYYAQDKNILCISTGSGWVQINPDTDTDISINSFTIGAARQDGKDWVFDLTLVEQDKDGNIKNATGQDIGKFTGEIRITPDMVASLSVNVAVKTTSAAVTDNTAVIKTGGIGADTASGVTIKNGANVSITGEENEIIISAEDTKYALSNDGSTKVILKDGNGSPAGEVVFEAGTALTATAEDGKITYSHNASGVTAGEYKASKSVSGNTTTVQVPSFSVDAQGHVTVAKKEAISFSDTTYSAQAVSADNTGKIKFSIADQNGTPTEATSGQDLYYTISIDGAEAETIYNQGFLGNFYSKTAIDNKFKGLDAFTYKGTVTSADDLNAKTGVTIGDTYKASTGFVLNGENVHIGDIIIANGIEVDGVIADVEWDVIHSENNTDTTYTLTAANNKITLEDSNGTPQNITLADDDVVLLTSAGNTISAAHAKVGANKTVGGNGGNTDYSGSIVVPQITVDEYGHVTAAEDKTYTLPQEHEYNFEVDATNETLYLLEDTDRKATLDFDGDDWISADLTAIEKGGKLTIAHKNVTRTNSTSTKTVDYGQTFTAVTSLLSDAKGHVTGATTTTVTLPAETIYALSGATLETVTGGVKVTDTLTGKNGVQTTSVFSLVSSNDNLKVTAAEDTITMSLVWGTF